MSYPLFQDSAMKRYKIHPPRRNLLSVPRSVRPDRIERGLRLLRALRFSIAAIEPPVARPQQGNSVHPLAEGLGDVEIPRVTRIARTGKTKRLSGYLLSFVASGSRHPQHKALKSSRRAKIWLRHREKHCKAGRSFCYPYVHLDRIGRKGRLFLDMDVSGTIDAILSQKGSEIFAVSPDTTVYAAIELMAQKNVGALVVVENGTLVGLLSERDYTRKITLRGKRSRETPVREIMSTNLTTVTPREPVENCLRMMTEKRIRHLPVVDGDMLRGIISIGDLVKWVIASQSATIAHLESYISGGYSG